MHYHYRGNEGERVPGDVHKLIVDGSVEELPLELCYGHRELREVIVQEGVKVLGEESLVHCFQLEKVKIPSTTVIIGQSAFYCCMALKEIDFVQPSTLREIGTYAFNTCNALERITPPSTANLMGEGSFTACTSLIEVNLFHSQVTEIPIDAFFRCLSLQSVRLPNLLERIMQGAFGDCSDLVTVEIASSVDDALDIRAEAFSTCESLCNVQIPPGSVVGETTFARCILLQECLGQEPSDIVQGLVHRFDEYPVHKRCYHSSTTTPDELVQCIANQGQDQALVDQFGNSPFHVLLSSVEPRHDLLEVLLNRYPGHVLGLKDENGKRAMDHLLTNWTENTRKMLQVALQYWIFNRLDHWGISSWRDAMVLRVNELLGEEDKGERVTLSQAAGEAMERYDEARKTFFLLEMALWKKDLMASERMGMDRDECRHLCGSDVVILHVATFLEL